MASWRGVRLSRASYARLASSAFQFARELEERGIGFDVAVGRLPIVPSAVLFDLLVGDMRIRPDAAAGYAACDAASTADPAEGNYRKVDDRTFGGGPGMVMLVEPLRRCLATMRQADPVRPHLVYLSPQGRRLDQARVRDLAALPRLALLCGRYEGVDERLVQAEVDEELSIGDYVLSGGELAAMVVMDAIVRQIPGALGDADSASQDSFVGGLLDCPHYTRPEVHEGVAVPPVLLSGNHADIARWRLKQALGRTWQRRPDLLERRGLSEAERALLNDAFSAIGVEDYKNFLRLRLDPDGTLSVFAIGLTRVAKRWKLAPEGGPSDPHLVPADRELTPHLIERVVIAPSNRRSKPEA